MTCMWSTAQWHADFQIHPQLAGTSSRVVDTVNDNRDALLVCHINIQANPEMDEITMRQAMRFYSMWTGHDLPHQIMHQNSIIFAHLQKISIDAVLKKVASRNTGGHAVSPSLIANFWHRQAILTYVKLYSLP